MPFSSVNILSLSVGSGDRRNTLGSTKDNLAGLVCATTALHWRIRLDVISLLGQVSNTNATRSSAMLKTITTATNAACSTIALDQALRSSNDWFDWRSRSCRWGGVACHGVVWGTLS